MNSKKLLYIVNVDWFFISHRLPIALSAMKNGYEVHLACALTDKRDYLLDLGIKLHEIPFSRSGRGLLNELNTLKQIYQVLTKVRPDVLHTVTIKPVLYGGAMARLARVPAVVAAVSGLGLVFVADDFKTKITKTIAKVLYKLAFGHRNLKVIFQNSSDRKLLVDSIQLANTKIVMIKGSGADLTEYCFKPEPVGLCTVVMASRLLKEKGVYQFVEAANILKRKRVAVQFLLAGEPDPGNPNSVTERELQQWKNEGTVKILGFRSDISNLFSNSNIVALPSFYGEGLPKVLIEAAACGRAIITTNNPGCREALIDGETGLVVPVKDATKLAEAIESLVLDKSKRALMGRRARKFAEAEFDIGAVVSKHLDIYSELIGSS
jgi:glycosyltransferase involved in cell wall biosynthesis